MQLSRRLRAYFTIVIPTAVAVPSVRTVCPRLGKTGVILPPLPSDLTESGCVPAPGCLRPQGARPPAAPPRARRFAPTAPPGTPCGARSLRPVLRTDLRHLAPPQGIETFSMTDLSLMRFA